MLNSGINVVSAFTTIRNQTKNRKTYRALDNIVESIHEGKSLYESIKDTKHFEDSFCEMVRVGEETGKLDVIFDNLSNYYYKEYKSKQFIKEAMTYPIFILVITIIASIVMMFTILPMIDDMVKSLSIKSIPMPTKILITISRLIEDDMFILVSISIITGVLSIIIKFKGFIFHRIITKIAGFSSLYKMVIAEKFARSLALLWSSGVPIIEALFLCESLLGKYYSSYVRNIKVLVEEGGSLFLSIKQSGLFPEFFANMIETGEESGRLDSVLESIADFYEKEVGFASKRLSKIFEPILIISMSLVVGFVLAGVLLPVFQIYAEV